VNSQPEFYSSLRQAADDSASNDSWKPAITSRGRPKFRAGQAETPHPSPAPLAIVPKASLVEVPLGAARHSEPGNPRRW
jgi:hypothetical protein